MKLLVNDHPRSGRLKWGYVFSLMVVLLFPVAGFGQSIITCPAGPVDLCSDQLNPICLELPITGADSVTVTGAPGAGWADGKLCFSPSAAGQYQLEVTAWVGTESESCTISANVSFGQPPTIVCPAEPYKVNLCSPGQVCLFMATRNARTLSAMGATVENGNLCFQADSSGTYNLIAVASNACGADSCNITVEVTIGAKPAIECPTEPIAVSMCDLKETCVPLAISGAEDVQVNSGGSWSNGNLCFTPDTAGTYTFTVTAASKCGKSSCEVTVVVTQLPRPAIACPTEPAQFTLCDFGKQVCAPVTILHADSISVSDGASWIDGSICFTPDSAGQYTFRITASNSCDQATCDVKFLILTLPAPEIACPAEPIKAATCAGKSICQALTITNANSVEVSQGATWGDGKLCFVADTTGHYSFTVTASNSCKQATCEVAFDVTVGAVPHIVCPAEPIHTDICGAERVCIPIAVADAGSVEVSSGTWESGQFCFEADTSGTYEFNIKAVAECGTDSCSFSVQVNRREKPTLQCPSEPLVAVSCSKSVCVPFIAKAEWADSVIAQGAHLSDDNICFTADEPGMYTIPLTAYGPCGTASCSVLVNVEFVTPPAIACVDSLLHFSICQPGTVCVPMAISHADSVVVIDGNWDAELQKLCFTAEQTGEYDVTVIAQGKCVADTCHVHAAITITQAPVIACPEQPLSGSICKPGEVCVDLAISNATQVTIPGATWNNDKLCFQADTTGTYTFAVEASNGCHSSSCTITVHVELMEALHACFAPQYGGKPLTVTFGNCTTPVGSFQYHWNFGDSLTSTDYSPTHTFGAPGCYAISLEATGFCGTDTLTSIMVDTLCVQDSNFVVPTDQWINVFCQAPKLDGSPLAPGDVIAAYAPGNVLCGLDVVRSDGSFGFMPVYRDDQFTPSVEGAKPGDTITFRINGHVAYTVPSVVWTANGDRIQVCSFASELCKDLVMGEGWHLVSWNVPLAGDIDNVFGNQLQCIEVILSYDRGGATFDPDMSRFSTLHRVDYSHGYWIKVKPACTVTLHLCGATVTSGSIPMYRGWNLVSYWPNHSESPANALASLGSTIWGVWTFDNGALVYKPDMPDFNTLDSMNTYYGYWVKVTAPGSLTYPGFGETPSTIADPSRSVAEAVAPSRTWMSLFGESITVDGQALASGSRIAAFTSQGVLCGEGIYSDGLLKFTPVYGKDEADAATKVYASTNDDILIEVDGKPVYPSVKWQGQGARVRLAALTSSSQGTGEIPRTFSLAQNYPNPFNPSTTIEYSLPTASQVVIEVFNVAGQKVKTLVDGPIEAGVHSTAWDGLEENGTTAASGIYFYRLRAGTYSETRKMLLLK
jgi:PKD repeat protein